MSHKEPTIGQRVLIGRDYWDVPVRIRLRAYLHFGRRMDSQLRRLVARWSHTASPAARGVHEEAERSGQDGTSDPRPPPLAAERAAVGRRPSGRPDPQ